MSIQNWAVTNRETGQVHFVQREAGEHPSTSGYGPKADFAYVKLDREPGEADRFDGKKLVRCDQRARAIRHQRREPHHSVTRADMEDYLFAAVSSLFEARGLAPVSAEEVANLFPSRADK